jgi:hypothetical protein
VRIDDVFAAGQDASMVEFVVMRGSMFVRVPAGRGGLLTRQVACARPYPRKPGLFAFFRVARKEFARILGFFRPLRFALSRRPPIPPHGLGQELSDWMHPWLTL